MRAGSMIALATLLALAGCVAPVGPVAVTRFHAADVSPLGHGSIEVVPAAGVDGGSLEIQSYQAAVANRLAALGYRVAAPGGGAQIAEIRVSRQTLAPQNAHGPVSVGVGGSTGSYGSGLGLGISFDLSGRGAGEVATELAVRISARAPDKALAGAVLWEGRASFTVDAKSPLASSQLGAAKLAAALFAGFPGHSGETTVP